jgi:hypothetical protein
MRFATDADVKQAVTSWLQTTDTDLPTPGYTPRCQGGTNSYVDDDNVEVRYVLSATQVPCVRYVISETALYKLQYPHEQQAKLQELHSVQSWCFAIYIKSIKYILFKSNNDLYRPRHYVLKNSV